MGKVNHENKIHLCSFVRKKIKEGVLEFEPREILSIWTVLMRKEKEVLRMVRKTS